MLVIIVNSIGGGGAEKFLLNLAQEFSMEGRIVRVISIRPPEGGFGHEMISLYGGNVDIQYYSGCTSLLSIFNAVRDLLSLRVKTILYCGSLAEVVSVLYKVIGFKLRIKLYSRIANTKLRQGVAATFFRLLACKLGVNYIFLSSEVEKSFFRSVRPLPSCQSARIPNGIKFEKLKDICVSDIRGEHSLPKDKFLIAHMGSFRFDPDAPGLSKQAKAHDIVLKAFKLVQDQLCEAHLVLIGDGDMRPEAQEMARDLGVDRNVTFVGMVSNPQRLLLACDLFVFPSRFEGMPNALIEASAMGLPVVASDIPEIKCINPGGWFLSPVDDYVSIARNVIKIAGDLTSNHRVAMKDADVIRRKYDMKTCAERYKMFLSLGDDD